MYAGQQHGLRDCSVFSEHWEDFNSLTGSITEYILLARTVYYTQNNRSWITVSWKNCLIQRRKPSGLCKWRNWGPTDVVGNTHCLAVTSEQIRKLLEKLHKSKATEDLCYPAVCDPESHLQHESEAGQDSNVMEIFLSTSYLTPSELNNYRVSLPTL